MRSKVLMFIGGIAIFAAGTLVGIGMQKQSSSLRGELIGNITDAGYCCLQLTGESAPSCHVASSQDLCTQAGGTYFDNELSCQEACPLIEPDPAGACCLSSGTCVDGVTKKQCKEVTGQDAWHDYLSTCQEVCEKISPKKIFCCLEGLYCMETYEKLCGDDEGETPYPDLESCKAGCMKNGPPEYCGDGKCNMTIGENSTNCPADCKIGIPPPKPPTDPSF